MLVEPDVEARDAEQKELADVQTLSFLSRRDRR